MSLPRGPGGRRTRVRRWLAPALLSLALVAGAGGQAGCALFSAQVQTDPTIIAQRAILVVKVLDVVVEALLVARDAGWISRPVNLAIQDDIRAALPLIAAAPDGGRAVAVATLRTAEARISHAQARRWILWGVTAVGALP